MNYSHTSVLVVFRTHQTLYSLHFDEKKGLVALASTGVSHNAAPQEKMLHRSGLVSSSTGREFLDKSTMSTEVPLYFKVDKSVAFSTFTTLYNHHIYIVPNHFHPPKRQHHTH